MELTYPTKREVGQIIDSQVPAGKGYASFQESNNLGCGCNIYIKTLQGIYNKQKCIIDWHSVTRIHQPY